MRIGSLLASLALLTLAAGAVAAEAEVKISEATDECLTCHRSATPGIVADWERSRHSKVTPAQALAEKDPLKRRISAARVPDEVANVVVGCAECHTARPGEHKDTFAHSERQVHIVVTPKDCAICHPTEVEQYDKNMMSKAYLNLRGNPLYHNLVTSVIGPEEISSAGKVVRKEPTPLTEADSCYACHGTKIEVKGLKERETADGKMSFPVLEGWPNQGVGRVNPDGSTGACTACHARHQFSLEVARSPETCSQCHSGPDVPAYHVYEASKHGNIFNAIGRTFNMDAVPWTVGKDFTAPTCATCHISLIVNPSGKVLAERTHQMNDRLPWRLFGLPYAHPHPISPETAGIKNKDGYNLPTELTGEPVAGALIDAKEQQVRTARMKAVCLPCHSTSWVDSHFERLENTIKTTNDSTRAATILMKRIWKAGLADPSNIFDEAIERKWVETWLMHANSARLASAMAGADIGVFTGGRWQLSKLIQELEDYLHVHAAKEPAAKRKK